MSFELSALKGKIVEVFGSQTKFAEAMGWTDAMLSFRMNGHVAWKQEDIAKACELLDIKEEEVGKYFFRKKEEK